MKLPVEHTQGEYWGGTQLNISHIKWASILGGFFGIDHLLLRSPTTAFIKVIANIITLGYFYWYDVLQFTVEPDLVKEKGLRIPFMGDVGLGAGIFHSAGKTAAPATSPKPYLFALYCIAVLIGFGLDFLIAGDFPGAAAKIFSIFPLILFFLTPIFWVFTLLWYVYNIIRTYIYTGSTVLSKDASNEKRGIAHFFPFTLFMKPYYVPNGRFIPLEPEQPESERPLGFPWNMFSAFITTPIKVASESVIKPIEVTASAYAEAAKATATAVGEGAAAVGKTVAAAGDLAGRAPEIIQAVTPLLAAQAAQQHGGGKPTDTTLLAVFAFLMLGGFGLTAFRAFKSNSEQDDRPPGAPARGKSVL